MNLYDNKTFELLKKGTHRQRMYPGWGPGMRNCYVIHYVISGTGYLKANGKLYTIHAGESFLITPFTTVHYYPDSEDRWLYSWIDFTGDKITELFSKLNWNTANPVCRLPLADKLSPLYEKLGELDMYIANPNEAAGIFSAILGVYIDALSYEANAISRDKHRLSSALSIIHTNYHLASFNIDKLSGMLNLSNATLYRLFSNGMSMSPISYLQHYRIEQAKKMLSNGASVKEASISCGYENSLYFSRAFKKLTGCAPSRFTTYP